MYWGEVSTAVVHTVALLQEVPGPRPIGSQNAGGSAVGNGSGRIPMLHCLTCLILQKHGPKSRDPSCKAVKKAILKTP